MGRWVIALVAAGVVLVAAAARAQTDQVVLAPTVFASHNLPSDAITGFTVSCPAGYAAVSAGVSRPGAGLDAAERPPGRAASGSRSGSATRPRTTRRASRSPSPAARSAAGPGAEAEAGQDAGRRQAGDAEVGHARLPAEHDPGGSRRRSRRRASAKSVDSFAGAALSVREHRPRRCEPSSSGSRTPAAARTTSVVNGNCADGPARARTWSAPS